MEGNNTFGKEIIEINITVCYVDEWFMLATCPFIMLGDLYICLRIYVKFREPLIAENFLPGEKSNYVVFK